MSEEWWMMNDEKKNPNRALCTQVLLTLLPTWVIAMCSATGWDELYPIVGWGWGGRQNLKYCQTGFEG